MGNRPSKSTPLSQGFQLYSKLPMELKQQILQQAANDWIHQFVDGVQFWTTDFGARVFLISIDVDLRLLHIDHDHCDYVMRFPSLLFVNTDSRNIMYDTLLNYKVPHKMREPVSKCEDIHLFFRCSGGQKDFLLSPQIYGWRVQDFRYPGLRARVQAERERLKEMAKEMAEMNDMIMIRRYNAGRIEYTPDGEVVGLRQGRRDM